MTFFYRVLRRLMVMAEVIDGGGRSAEMGGGCVSFCRLIDLSQRRFRLQFDFHFTLLF